MTETDTRHASLELYRFMCQDIVGTEEHVKTLRMLNNVRDHLTIHEDFLSITSGSFGEGLVMEGSDLDFMEIMKTVEVCEDKNTNFKPDLMYLKIRTEDTPPGFIQLCLVYSPSSEAAKGKFVEVDGEYYFSNIRIKDRLLGNYPTIPHGPCLSDKEGIFDFAPCIHCKSWITPAKNWITRSNNSWPGCDIKETIVNHGVLFVPVGIKGSPKEESEWRVSFSVGEKFLVYTFTHTQLLCYALLKILLKDIIATNVGCEDLLCSYFLKIIMFWISEELIQTQWIEENLIFYFLKCFRRLIYCVRYSVCPHYFIPENNLFENKINGQARRILLDTLLLLNSYGWQCILFSDQINDLAYYLPTKPINSHIDSIERFLFSIIYMVDSYSIRSINVENEIHRLLSIESPKIKSFYTYYLSKMYKANSELLQFTNLLGNKSTNKCYKNCISSVLRSISHDAVSGWLLLASFFYHTKQYRKALYILQYSLLKCTPEKLYFLHFSNVHHELLNLTTFKKMSIVRLFKFLKLNPVYFHKNSVLIPNEIKIDIPCIIPPVVFAHFLCSLCYYHLKDDRQCQNSLEDLKLTIDENYFIAQFVEKANSHTLLGVISQTIGDMESTRHAFIQSIKLFPDPENNAYHRLELLN